MIKTPHTAPDNDRQQKLEAFDRLLTVMDQLRAYCPWDIKQTNDTLRHLTIEETYELSDAILLGNNLEIKKELGDILLHIIFYAKISAEKSVFDITDVINSLIEKLIYRHPHIYGDATADTEEDVKRNWEQLKLKEKGNLTKSTLGGVPQSLPSLIKAMRIQEKARGVGFDWDNKDQVWAKVQEEIAELNHETNAKEPNNIKIESEFGDVLFSMVNYARFIGINPDQALESTNKKFIKRFRFIESKAAESGEGIANLSLSQMEVYWQMAKLEAE